MKVFYSLARGFLKAEKGLAAVEFALSLPLLIAVSVGTIEVTRYVMLAQKVERASISISDLVAQSSSITTAQLNQLMPAAGEIMSPYNFSADGYAIISSVKKTGTNNPVVTWQYRSSGTSQTSRVGVNGGAATMPSGFTMVAGDAVIITEIFFSYRPLMPGMIYSNSQMYRYSIYKPRLGDLTVLGALFPDRKEMEFLCPV